MSSEDVKITHIQPVQVELVYASASDSLLTNKEVTIHLAHNKCPTGVALEDVTKVTKLLQLEKKHKSLCKSKIQFLKSNHVVVASSKLLGMKYNMDDVKKNIGGGPSKIDRSRTCLIQSSKTYKGYPLQMLYVNLYPLYTFFNANFYFLCNVKFFW
jgi:hypothetical protein